MKKTRIMWDMPITVDIADAIGDSGSAIEDIYTYFSHVDAVFSTFRPDSEVSRINHGSIKRADWSKEFCEVIDLCDRTQKETSGYFSYRKNGEYHPLGLVKGWALDRARVMLEARGFCNFYIEAGGDIALRGHNENGMFWRVGVRNPFDRNEIVKAITLTDCGIATSGTYIRGNHIYTPMGSRAPTSVVSLTVIGSSACQADRFATAAFAMGERGIEFIEQTAGLEGYQITQNGIATYTSGFSRYITL